MKVLFTLAIVVLLQQVKRNAAFVPCLNDIGCSGRTLMAASSTTRTTMPASSKGSVVDLMDVNFGELFQSEQPLLIDAYSTWCGPCKLIEPIIEKCARDRSSDLAVSRWNVEALQTDVKIELLLQGANPSKLPTLILVQEGRAQIIHEGLINQERLDEILDEELKPSQKKNKQTHNNMKSNRPGSSESDKISPKRKAGFISFMGRGTNYYPGENLIQP